MRPNGTALLLSLLLMGCAQREKIRTLAAPDGSGAIWISPAEVDAINAAAGGQRGEIELRDGREFQVRNVQATSQSLAWVDTDAERQERPYHEIRVLRLGKSNKVALLSGLAGVGLGIALGIALGEPDCPPGSFCIEQGPTAALGAIVFGLTGGCLGSFADAGKSTSFVFEPPRARSDQN